MEKKFIKEYYSKNKYEKYFHREFTQTYNSRRKTLLTPDFKRKNNSKKYNRKIFNNERVEKYNIKYINSKWVEKIILGEWRKIILLIYIRNKSEIFGNYIIF